MKKLGSASRATFVSPYLRRPLRPLDKVLSERDEPDSTATGLLAGDSADEAASGWEAAGKGAAVSD